VEHPDVRGAGPADAAPGGNIDAAADRTPPAPRAVAPRAASWRRGASSEEIEGVLSYVPAVARRYLGCGLELDELIAAGNLGLVRAALRFDPSREIKFITYASWWIRKAILEALEEQTGPVRVPRYQHEKLRTLRAARADMRSRLGDEPSEDQLAAASGFARRETEMLLRIGGISVSLEQPLSPGDDRPLKDVLSDQVVEDPQHRLVRRELARRLHEQLARLDSRERKVISMRFGFDGQNPVTLREAGRRLGISRERVRQLELRILVKLRRLV
jgi:RNA polymerase primary sigma factor